VALATGAAGWRELDTHCRMSSLARFKKPRAYLTLEKLPRNAANKVLRQTLREAVCSDRAGGNSERFSLVDG
jgi:acyl-coenzyme A synthetase/AMP-(fatty) acid ligase